MRLYFSYLCAPAMIKPETVREILESAHVEDVVGDFVSLRKRGVNLIGLCPFHNEKTPSFTVSPAKGIYKCFGCGKAGSAVNFIMEHEHYSYPEALKFLAGKYNIEIEEEEQTPEQLQALSEQESLYNVTAYASKYFANAVFNTERGRAVALSYFKERGYREETIKKFELGYSPETWDAFTKHALDNGYKLDLLEKAGLTISKDNRQFDRFRSRVIFPIHNLTGRVIGFGGRILNTEASKAKYVNSPESVIYNKSRVLYGIYFAKSAIIKNDICYLVEGYTDVITLHQTGIENVVSSSGTSLTVDQIKLIKRYTRNITILYDGDAAGIKASFRGIDMILEQGMNVRIVLFPEGEDPDSYARSHRSTEVEDFISKEAHDFIIFKTNLLLNEAANDPIKKAALIKEIVSSISLIPDGIYRSVYVKECSSVMDIPEQSLLHELNRLLRRRFNKKQQQEGYRDEVPGPTEYIAPKQKEPDTLSSEFQERDIVRLLLLYGENMVTVVEDDEEMEMSVVEMIIHDILEDELTFQDPDCQFIFDNYVTELNNNVLLTEKYFINHPDPKIAKMCIDLVASPYELSKRWEENHISTKSEFGFLKDTITSSMLAFKSKKVDQLIAENQQQLKDATDDENIQILLHQQQMLKEASKEINARLGRIITK